MFKHLKHLLNVIILHSWVVWNIYEQVAYSDHFDGGSKNNGTVVERPVPPNSKIVLFGLALDDICLSVLFFVASSIQYTILLPIPQIICNFLGLTFFNAFPDDVELKIHPKPKTNGGDEAILTPNGEDNQGSIPIKNCINENNKCNIDVASNYDPPTTSLIPHLCFRVVTRGNYPELVQTNVHQNFLTCLDAGLINFSIEVVTDQDIFITNSTQDDRIRQIIVPKSYKTSTGALFKARALQYALEPGVSPVKIGDYIVHLDEETIITKNSALGISNFALDGRYDFGQGLITYGNLPIVNISTTMADSYRVAEDMGKIQFQLAVLHKPIFGWKGSFVVTKYEAELEVSYDHGPDGSIAEDCFFAMVAMHKGFKFDFIQGEMFEKSPFTIGDFLRQRKRWIQGIWLVVYSSKIPIKTKILLAFSHYASITLPISTINVVVNMIFRLPVPLPLLIAGKICFAITVYMYFFGLLKTYDLKPRALAIIAFHLFIQFLTITFNAFLENIAVVWAVFTTKHNFYVVKKDIEKKVILDS